MIKLRINAYRLVNIVLKTVMFSFLKVSRKVCLKKVFMKNVTILKIHTQRANAKANVGVLKWCFLPSYVNDRMYFSSKEDVYMRLNKASSRPNSENLT